MRTTCSLLFRMIRQYGLLVLAIICMVVGGWYIFAPKVTSSWMRSQGARHNAQLLANQAVALADEPYHFGTPTSLSLPRIGVSLSVLPGTYHAGSQSWTLDRTHAFYMSGAQTPATPIIYGHNIPAVFTKLDGVALDELLRITLSDGRVLLYKYVDDVVVVPTDHSVLGVGKSRTIFLMTCTGPTFDDRRLLEFEFVGEAQNLTRGPKVEDSYESLS